MMSDTHIFDLPDELTVQILEMLDSSNLITVSKVHPEWLFIIDRYIGYGVEIGTDESSKYWYYADEGLRKISVAELDTVSIRDGNLGMTIHQPQALEGLHVKNAFLMKTLTIGYAIKPSHFESLLIKQTPVALKSLEIKYQSLIIPMAGLFDKLNLPNLKELTVKDSGISSKGSGMQKIEWISEKAHVMENVVSNLSALLTVNFPRLKTFTFELASSVENLTQAQQGILVRGCFEFLVFNRRTISNFNFCLKNGLCLNDEGLALVIQDASDKLTLSSVNMAIHPAMDYQGYQSIMAFYQRQKTLKTMNLSADIISVQNILPVVLTNNSKLAEIDINCRSTLQNQDHMNPGFTLDFNVFQNCTNLKALKLVFHPKKKIWRTLPGGEESETPLKICGFTPLMTNARNLPKTLESIHLASLGISTTDIQFMLNELGNLRVVILDGSWCGSGTAQSNGIIQYGPNDTILLEVLKKRKMDKITLGPFPSGSLANRGMSNRDPNHPLIIKTKKNTTVIKLVKNENGYYKSA